MSYTINLTDILGSNNFGQSRLDINNNFLVLKDIIEDLFNGFSIDLAANKFGTSLLDLTAKNVTIVDGKFKITYTQGTTQITRDIFVISGVNNNEITLAGVDHLTVNIDAFINKIDSNEVNISNTGTGLTNAGPSNLTGPVLLGSSVKESLIDVNLTLNSSGETTLAVNANTQNNLFLVLDATAATLATNFNITPIIDVNTPDGLVFSVYLKNITGSTIFNTSPTSLVDIYFDRDKTVVLNSGNYKFSETPYNSCINCMVVNNGSGKRIVVKSIINLE